MSEAPRGVERGKWARVLEEALRLGEGESLKVELDSEREAASAYRSLRRLVQHWGVGVRVVKRGTTIYLVRGAS